MMHWGREKSQNPRPQRQKGQILLQRDVSFETRLCVTVHSVPVTSKNNSNASVTITEQMYQKVLTY